MIRPTQVFDGRRWLYFGVLLATAMLALRAGPGLAARPAPAAVPAARTSSTADAPGTGAPPVPAAVVGVAPLLRTLADLGQLCWLRDDRCLQFSSYDRSGGNGDSGHYLNGDVGRLPDDTAVLAEMDGPGAVVRLWSANPAGTLRIYLDGSEQPVLEAPMADLFAGKVPPFAPPLATRSSGGFVSYFPIPYQKHCRITAQGAGNLYYQIDYRTFPPGTVVKPFTRELDAGEQAALAQVAAAWNHPGPDWSQVRGWRRLRLRPGKTAPLLQQVGPGTIRGLYLRLPRDLRQARRLVLRAYWDEEPQPSIEAPLLDLFGSGWQSTEIDIAALPLGRGKEGWYFRLPMPFRRSARLTVENESEHTVELHAAVDVDPGEPASPPAGWGYLHARWDRALTAKGTPHEWVHVHGRGHFVGVVQSMSAAPLGFLEGDERIWSDGDKVWNGTGTEDYFNSGWYFNGGPVSQPLHGAVRKSDAGVSAYRFHLNDAVPFQHELHAEIEHGGTDDTHDEDYASVAFWYAAHPEPAESSPSLAATFLAPPYQRFEAPAGAIVPAQAIGAPPPGAALGWLSPPLTGTPALLITEDHHAAVPFHAEPGHYRVRVAVDRQPHLGRLSLRIDGHPIARHLHTGTDTDPEVAWVEAGEVNLAAGEHSVEMGASGGMVAVRAIAVDRVAADRPRSEPARAGRAPGSGRGPHLPRRAKRMSRDHRPAGPVDPGSPERNGRWPGRGAGAAAVGAATRRPRLSTAVRAGGHLERGVVAWRRNRIRAVARAPRPEPGHARASDMLSCFSESRQSWGERGPMLGPFAGQVHDVRALHVGSPTTRISYRPPSCSRRAPERRAMTALQAIKGWITGDVNTLPTRSLEDLKKITRILFIDDQKFEVVQILINAGWANTERVQDVSSLDSPAIIDAHIVFVDIRGVGKKLQFHDEGLALIGALRQKYPYKKLVVYSAETTGDRFHKALSDADYRLSKNADPFQFQSLVEEYSRDAFSLAECVSRLQKIIRAEFGVNLTDEQIMARMRQLARRGDYSQHLVERVFNLSNAGSIASIVGLFMQPK